MSDSIILCHHNQRTARNMTCYAILSCYNFVKLFFGVNAVQFYAFIVNGVLFNVFKPIVLIVNLNEHLHVGIDVLYCPQHSRI